MNKYALSKHELYWSPRKGESNMSKMQCSTSNKFICSTSHLKNHQNYRDWAQQAWNFGKIEKPCRRSTTQKKNRHVFMRYKGPKSLSLLKMYKKNVRPSVLLGPSASEVPSGPLENILGRKEEERSSDKRRKAGKTRIELYSQCSGMEA